MPENMDPAFISIRQCRDLPTAGLLRSKLETEGIRCYLENEYTIGVNWLYSNALGGIKLMVLSEDADRARAVLFSYEETDLSDEIKNDEQTSLLRCPRCGSAEVTPVNYTRRFAALSLLFTLPLFFFLKRNRCKMCGNRWK